MKPRLFAAMTDRVDTSSELKSPEEEQAWKQLKPLLEANKEREALELLAQSPAADALRPRRAPLLARNHVLQHGKNRGREASSDNCSNQGSAVGAHRSLSWHGATFRWRGGRGGKLLPVRPRAQLRRNPRLDRYGRNPISAAALVRRHPVSRKIANSGSRRAVLAVRFVLPDGKTRGSPAHRRSDSGPGRGQKTFDR